jgi:hypothetical protein
MHTFRTVDKATFTKQITEAYMYNIEMYTDKWQQLNMNYPHPTDKDLPYDNASLGVRNHAGLLKGEKL